MKTTFLKAVFLLLIIASCSSDDDSNAILEHGTFKVNDALRNATTIEANSQLNNGEAFVNIELFDEDALQGISITFPLNTPQGTYSLNRNEDTEIIGMYRVQQFDGSLPGFYALDGTVELTCIDSNNGKFEGTFAFSTTDEVDLPTIFVTEGAFLAQF